ncbi:protein of unknown function [Clostridium beijerinckii]|nr:protein of unknown function [Clostridium beijerinckii]
MRAYALIIRINVWKRYFMTFKYKKSKVFRVGLITRFTRH